MKNIRIFIWKLSVFGCEIFNIYLNSRVFVMIYIQGKQQWNENSALRHTRQNRCPLKFCSIDYPLLPIAKFAFINPFTISPNNSFNEGREIYLSFMLFSVKYRDFSVKSKPIISLFQTIKLRLSDFHYLELLFFLPIKFPMYSLSWDWDSSKTR